MFVVLGPKTDEQFWCFDVVKKAMDIGKEDLDFAARAQEVGDFDNGNEVSTVWSARRCSAYVPVSGGLVRHLMRPHPSRSPMASSAYLLHLQ